MKDKIIKILENPKLKIVIFSLTIIIFLITGIYLSLSYYQLNKNMGKLVIKAGEFDVTYNESASLNIASKEPLYDKYRYEKANYIPFEISFANNINHMGHTACYAVYFDITKLDEALSSKFLRWELYDEDNKEIVSAGSFNGLKEGESIFLTGYNTMNPSDKHTFKLYIWLSYSKTENQLNMLGKEVNGNVRVESHSGNTCEVQIKVESLDETHLTLTNNIQSVASGTTTTVGFNLENGYVIENLCNIPMQITSEELVDGKIVGEMTFQNITKGQMCLVSASEKSTQEVWLANLSYDNTKTSLPCTDAQCALDQIVEMLK